MAGNPLNPLNWIQSAQNWFSKTERSSGFRPYLMFLLIHTGFVLVILTFFGDVDVMQQFVVRTLPLSYGGFIVLFSIKCFQDPDFCRSERHVENVRKLELMEKKGDEAPKLIYGEKVETISNPQISDPQSPESARPE